ncbi:MAG: metallophosphoesterase family protein [Chloroflexia bacterium]|nr:metallophosphoesterase family protein [Chloroflexia bacterium]
MRIAVMSDIHGFNLALETVLAHIDADGPFDSVIVAGDLCEGGPGPRQVIELLQGRDLIALTGNTDRDLVQAVSENDASGDWSFTLNELGPEGISYLAELPFAHRISPPGGASPSEDLLVVHANPHDLERKLDPSASDHVLAGIIGETAAGAIAFGHIHICYVRQLAATLLVDVSAAGNPKDGDLRCKYGVLTWDQAAARWRGEIRKLTYPLDATAAQIRASGLTNPEGTLRKLRKATY